MPVSPCEGQTAAFANTTADFPKTFQSQPPRGLLIIPEASLHSGCLPAYGTSSISVCKRRLHLVQESRWNGAAVRGIRNGKEGYGT